MVVADHDTQRVSEEKESGIESGNDSGNETFSSDVFDSAVTPTNENSDPALAQHRPSTLVGRIPKPDLPADSDIDALIAKLVVPPPPLDTPIVDDSASPAETLPEVAEYMDANTAQDQGETHENMAFPLPPLPVSHIPEHGAISHEDFSDLVIPPPPSNGEHINISDIPMVPPVDVSPVKDGELYDPNHVREKLEKEHIAEKYAIKMQDSSRDSEINNYPDISNLIKHLEAKAEMRSLSDSGSQNSRDSSQTGDASDSSLSHEKRLIIRDTDQMEDGNITLLKDSASRSLSTPDVHKNVSTFSTFRPSTKPKSTTLPLELRYQGLSGDSQYQGLPIAGNSQYAGVSLSAGNSPVHVPYTMKIGQTGRKRHKTPPPPPPRRMSSRTSSTESCNSTELNTENRIYGNISVQDKSAVEQLKQNFEKKSSKSSDPELQDVTAKKSPAIHNRIIELERLFKTEKGKESLTSDTDSKSDNNSVFEDTSSEASIHSAQSWDGTTSRRYHQKGHVREMADLMVRRTNSANDCKPMTARITPKRPLRALNSLPVMQSRDSYLTNRSVLPSGDQSSNSDQESVSGQRSSSEPHSPLLHQKSPSLPSSPCKGVMGSLPVIRSKKVAQPLVPTQVQLYDQ